MQGTNTEGQSFAVKQFVQREGKSFDLGHQKDEVWAHLLLCGPKNTNMTKGCAESLSRPASPMSTTNMSTNISSPAETSSSRSCNLSDNEKASAEFAQELLGSLAEVKERYYSQDDFCGIPHMVDASWTLPKDGSWKQNGPDHERFDSNDYGYNNCSDLI